MGARVRLLLLVVGHVMVLVVLHGLANEPWAVSVRTVGTAAALPAPDATAALARVLGIAVAWWSLGTVVLATVVHGLPARSPRARRMVLVLVPGPWRGVVRRGVAGVVVSGVLLGQGAAVAAPLPPALDTPDVLPATAPDDPTVDVLLPPGLPAVVTGTPSGHDSWPDGPVGAPASDRPTQPTADVGDATHVVVAGEHLWGIAAAHLASAGLPADDADVADYWRTLVARNRADIPGGDPDVVRPGLVLHLPPTS